MAMRTGYRRTSGVVVGLGVAAAAGLGLVQGKNCLLQTTDAQAAEQPPPALNPKEWSSFKLAERRQLTTNTHWFRFALPEPSQTTGLSVASCLVTRAPIGSDKPDGSKAFVIRPYTPTSLVDEKGYFDLIVKVYSAGKMSKHIGELKVGDSLEVKGPIPKLPVTPNFRQNIGMVAGGTGITPMYQVIQELLRSPENKSNISLIFGNVSEDDIILKKELDELANNHDNFNVFYIVDGAASPSWKGGVGYVTKEILKKYMPPPSDDNIVLVCGPPPMMKAISGDKAADKSQGDLTGLLKALGYTADQVFKF